MAKKVNKSSDLKARLHVIEAEAISEIERHAQGSVRGLSLRVYGTEDTLHSILSRVRASSPYKVAKLVRTLEEIEQKV